MTDPYKVLGISPDATDDEVKKAYRNLSRKYHPDANINNPNKEKAEEMFKLVQQAYQQIMDERSGKIPSSDRYSGGNGDFWGYGGQRSSRTDYSNPEMQAAANYINSRHYTEAMNVLNNISDRNGTWFYLHAIANAGLGNNVEAKADAQQAMEMEPDNYEFQRLYQQLSGGTWYNEMSQGYGYGGSPCGGGSGSSMDLCCRTLLCCSCCGGAGLGGIPLCCCI